MIENWICQPTCVGSLTSTTFMWTRTNKMKHLPSHDQNLRKNRLPFATHEFVPMPLFTFGIMHNFWPNNKNKFLSHRLKHLRSAHHPSCDANGCRGTSSAEKHVTCAHHTTFQWHCDPKHSLQNFNLQTNQQTLPESNASCMLTTVQKTKRRHQHTNRNLPQNKNLNSKRTKFHRHCTSSSREPSTMSVPKEHQREYSWHNDNTDDCEQFPLTNTNTQKNWHYRNKNKRCTTTLHHNHTARTVHQLWLSSTFQRTRFQQQLTDTGHPRHENLTPCLCPKDTTGPRS